VSQVKWKFLRNEADGRPDDPLPLFFSNGAAATLTADDPKHHGSFHVICYGDLDGDGAPGADDPQIVLNLALVQVIVDSIVPDIDSSISQYPPNRNQPNPETVVVQIGGNPIAGGFNSTAKVTLQGGGSDGSIGVDRINLFFAQNVVQETRNCSYDGGANLKTVYGPGAAGLSICGGTPNLFSMPMLDAAVAESTGGGSIRIGGASRRSTRGNAAYKWWTSR
jgi:hypothetical protein